MNSAQELKQKAIKLGFALVGITDASPIDTKQAEFLTRWLNAGYAAQMNYLHRNESIPPGLESEALSNPSTPSLRDEIEPL